MDASSRTDLKSAEQLKAFTAEKQLSYIRAVVIVFSTLIFLLFDTPGVKKELAYVLICLIWPYGAYVLIFKPYEKYPVFLASWFTYASDCVFTTLWIYATGGFYSPFHVIYLISIIAVSFRFELRITVGTAALYSAFYFALILYMGQLSGNESYIIVRTGFIFIIGFLTNMITKETLHQTEEKLVMQRLADEALEHQKKLAKSEETLRELNEKLLLRNNVFKHAEENSLTGSYAWDITSGKLQYSDNLYRILGCEPGEFEPSFEKYLDFIHPDDREQSIKIGEETLRTKTFKTTTNRIITKDNVLKYLRVTGKFTEEPGHTLMIGTLQDITNDVLMNETLQAKNAELERSNSELSSFNYIASHDLQEPVRKIHTFSNLILQRDGDSLTQSTKDYITRIGSSANRMQRLIEAFLNYSRMGSAEIVFEKTDLNMVIAEVKNNLQELLAEKKATLESAYLPTINAVPFQMQQLFENLFTNAIKYSKENVPPVIKVTSERVTGKDVEGIESSSRAQYWKITVSDNGIGFEQQYAEKIFEVFQRLHAKDQYAGTGIGLAICKKIVQAHKGSIKAKSKPGEGAAFTIYIPVRL
jgi:signal transduction histidine kinase